MTVKTNSDINDVDLPLASFDFDNLFVYDLANNHQGDMAHAEAIIRGMGEQTRKHNVRGVMKFQYRQMDTFIHPDHHKDSDNKHIPRFLANRLSNPDFAKLRKLVKDEGMLAMCTPFDEESVDVIVEQDFDLIKVASCSAKDWPLLEKIAESGLPIIFSTGGLEISNIDDLVSFFDHRGCDHAIMHCVSIYPTPQELCNLDQIDVLRERYKGKTIGWSTHEDPDDQEPVLVAYAKGARMFERHVGIRTEDYALNAYSSTPEQIGTWLASHQRARSLCGSRVRGLNQVEVDSIDTLRRGVFARKPIKSGQVIKRENVFFAMPYEEGQLDSGHWQEGIAINTDVAANGPVMMADTTRTADSDAQVLKQAVHKVKALLNQANVVLNSDFEVEYSHHYGLSRFNECGAVIINCINRSYCKKIIVQMPGQFHPLHFHKRKEETFQVLMGELDVRVNNTRRTLKAGEVCLVMPGVWHSFATKTGCVFEEISTTHYNDDSFYKDKAISRLARSERKTVVDHWGRFQL